MTRSENSDLPELTTREGRDVEAPALRLLNEVGVEWPIGQNVGLVLYKRKSGERVIHSVACHVVSSNTSAYGGYTSVAAHIRDYKLGKLAAHTVSFPVFRGDDQLFLAVVDMDAVESKQHAKQMARRAAAQARKERQEAARKRALERLMWCSIEYLKDEICRHYAYTTTVLMRAFDARECAVGEINIYDIERLLSIMSLPGGRISIDMAQVALPNSMFTDLRVEAHLLHEKLPGRMCTGGLAGLPNARQLDVGRFLRRLLQIYPVRPTGIYWRDIGKQAQKLPRASFVPRVRFLLHETGLSLPLVQDAIAAVIVGELPLGARTEAYTHMLRDRATLIQEHARYHFDAAVDSLPVRLPSSSQAFSTESRQAWADWFKYGRTDDKTAPARPGMGAIVRRIDTCD